MTFKEYLVNFEDEDLAKLLVKEEMYEHYVDYEVVIRTRYKTTDGKLFDEFDYNEAISHQIKLLNSEL